MKIEEAIRQSTPFRNAKERAAVNLMFTYSWLISRQKEAFGPFGITAQQYNVLRILRGQHPKPISTSDIRDRMLDRMSDVSRIVDRLVKKGLVTRKTCKADKRLVDVLIAPSGLTLLEQIDQREFVTADIMASLSVDEADLLSDLLDKLRGDS